MSILPKPPATYVEFVNRYPLLEEAWGAINRAGAVGPLDERMRRLIKLAVAIGAMREGAVHSSVRKARAIGISEEEIDQVVALAAGTLGLPSTVAAFSWCGTVPKEQAEEGSDGDG
jgi:alkylhydroperoxidase/carboxymuconolactone decarboxylase family protein YurZ